MRRLPVIRGFLKKSRCKRKMSGFWASFTAKWLATGVGGYLATPGYGIEMKKSWSKENFPLKGEQSEKVGAGEAVFP